MSNDSYATDLAQSVYTKLLVRYGAQWVRMWDGLEDEDVIADWAEVLDGVTYAGVHYAMQNLPKDRPPNAMQFRDICLAKPCEATHAGLLPRPVYDPTPEQKAKVSAMLEATRRKLTGRGFKQQEAEQ